MTGGKVRALHVEDNPGDVELLRELVRAGGGGRGCALEHAGSLAEADASIARSAPSVVLLDLTLPDAHGLEGLEEIERRHPSLPVIVLTGHADDETAAAALGKGAQDYLVKGRLTGAELARSIRYAIERKRVERRLAAQNAVARILAGAGSLEEAAGPLLAAISEGLGWAAAALWVPDAAGLLRCAAAHGATDVRVAPFVEELRRRSFPPGEGVPGRVLASARPMWVSLGDEGSDGVPRREAAAAEEVRAAIGFPVTSRGRAIAVVELFSAALVRDDDDLEALASIGSQVGQFIERRRAEGALLERAAVAELVAEVGLALGRGDTLDEVLRGCAEAAVRRLDAAAARIWTLPAREGALVLRASAGLASGPAGAGARVLLGEGAIGRIALERRPVHASGPPERAGIGDAEWARREGIAAFAGAPLLVDGELLGVAAVFSRRPLGAVALEGLGAVADAIALGGKRKLVEGQLRVSEARFRRLTESNMIGIFVGDFGGRILEGNDEMLRIAGRSREELAAGLVRWDLMTPPERRPAIAALDAELHARGVAGPLHTEWVREDGARAQVLLAVALLEGGSDQGIGIVLDLSERRRAEEALRKAEEQLRQAQKMEAVGRLAGGVAHDFNNMLAAITGYGDLALSRLRPDEPAREDLEQMQKAAWRAAKLTNQLLVFSRKKVLEPKIVDVNAVVNAISGMLARLIGEDIELRFSLARAPGTVRADPGQLEQVIMNLAVNARDAMPRGGRLTIETDDVEAGGGDPGAPPPGAYVLLAVSDTGCGMTREVQSHLFEPFFTTKEAGKGTGLGLSTVFGIVKQAGGHIGVYSEVGHGSTFKVYLPRLAEAQTASQRPQGVAGLRGSESVLLVEDEEIVRDIAGRILRMHGYSVLSARNGVEALETCDRDRPRVDILVTDVVMPRMSGRELFERLARLYPRLRVLYMSGYTAGAVAENGVLERGVALLQKPFTAEGFGRKMREVLDAPRASQGGGH